MKRFTQLQHNFFTLATPHTNPTQPKKLIVINLQFLKKVMFFNQVAILFYQKLFMFKYYLKLNLTYNWHVGCKGVKLQSPNITILMYVKQGQCLNTLKKTLFICLLYYNYSSNR